jgi:hypothetical protein
MDSVNMPHVLGATKQRGVVHIGGAAEQLGVTPEHLRVLEREGRIPPARRDYNGRIYSAFDIALLRSMGIGQRPRKLKRAEEVLGPRG